MSSFFSPIYKKRRAGDGEEGGGADADPSMRELTYSHSEHSYPKISPVHRLTPVRFYIDRDDMTVTVMISFRLDHGCDFPQKLG